MAKRDMSREYEVSRVSGSKISAEAYDEDDGLETGDVEYEIDFESASYAIYADSPKDKKSRKKDKKRRKLEEHLRLLHVYFKDLEHESAKSESSQN